MLDPDLPELYLRPGAALPLGPVMQFTDELPLDEITLLAHLDASGTAVGRLYEDDGDGHAHADGAYRVTEFRVTSPATTGPGTPLGDVRRRSPGPGRPAAPRFGR